MAKPWTDEDVKAAIELYSGGMSCLDISLRMDRSQDNVRRRLIASGVKMRSKTAHSKRVGFNAFRFGSRA